MARIYELTDAEHAAVLAGLRILQACMCNGDHLGEAIEEILTNGGTVAPIDANAIDGLCEYVNTGAR